MMHGLMPSLPTHRNPQISLASRMGGWSGLDDVPPVVIIRVCYHVGV